MCVCARMHACAQVCVCVHVCVHACACVCARACVRVQARAQVAHVRGLGSAMRGRACGPTAWQARTCQCMHWSSLITTSGQPGASTPLCANSPSCPPPPPRPWLHRQHLPAAPTARPLDPLGVVPQLPAAPHARRPPRAPGCATSPAPGLPEPAVEHGRRASAVDLHLAAQPDAARDGGGGWAAVCARARVCVRGGVVCVCVCLWPSRGAIPPNPAHLPWQQLVRLVRLSAKLSRPPGASHHTLPSLLTLLTQRTCQTLHPSPSPPQPTQLVPPPPHNCGSSSGCGGLVVAWGSPPPCTHIFIPNPI